MFCVRRSFLGLARTALLCGLGIASRDWVRGDWVDGVRRRRFGYSIEPE